MKRPPNEQDRRGFLKDAAAVLLTSSLPGGIHALGPSQPLPSSRPLGYSVQDVAVEAGVNFLHVSGGEHGKKYIIETTGSGIAFFDYDHDGWLDIFLVNGSSLDNTSEGPAPQNKLFHNNRDGTFTDVTVKAGLVKSGWGQGVCIGDFDNDGFDDLFVTYWGEDLLYHNNGTGPSRSWAKGQGGGLGGSMEHRLLVRGLRSRWLA